MRIRIRKIVVRRKQARLGGIRQLHARPVHMAMEARAVVVLANEIRLFDPPRCLEVVRLVAMLAGEALGRRLLLAVSAIPGRGESGGDRLAGRRTAALLLGVRVSREMNGLLELPLHPIEIVGPIRFRALLLARMAIHAGLGFLIAMRKDIEALGVAVEAFGLAVVGAAEFAEADGQALRLPRLAVERVLTRPGMAGHAAHAFHRVGRVGGHSDGKKDRVEQSGQQHHRDTDGDAMHDGMDTPRHALDVAGRSPLVLRHPIDRPLPRE